MNAISSSVINEDVLVSCFNELEGILMAPYELLSLMLKVW